MPGTACQPGGIYGNHSNRPLTHLYQTAGEYRTNLRLRYREESTADQLPHSTLRNGNSVVSVHFRKVRIIIGIHCRDLEGGCAASDLHGIFGIYFDGYFLIGQLADNIEE